MNKIEEPLIVKISNEEERKKKYIFERGNFISKLFFSHIKEIITLSNKKEIKEEDLGNLSEKNSSKNLSFKIKKDYIFKQNLSKILFQTHKKEFYMIFTISLISITLKFLTISTLRKIIMYFRKENKKENKEIIFLSFKFIIFQLINIFLSKHLEYKNNIISIKINAEIKYLIFQKIFKLTKKTKIDNSKLINFIQNDSQKIMVSISTFSNLISFPILILIYTIMLFKYLGYIFFFGFLALIINFGFTFYLQNQMKNLQMEKQKKIDERIKITSNTLNNIKYIKENNYDSFFLKKILISRNKELISYNNLFKVANKIRTFLWFSPIFISLISIIFYQYFSNNVKVENIFTCLSIFISLQDPIREFSNSFTNIFSAYSSLIRIQNFLKEKEIFNLPYLNNNDNNNNEIIKISNGNFGYFENKYILKNINLSINKGELIIIIGKIGSGKTTLFNSLLNNIISSSESKIKINNNSIAYTSQNPFIKNDTIRNNIIFFNEYNEEKYNKIIKLCELEKDIKNFSKNSFTLLNEKGNNISGGQKSRISLARALYSNKEIYLFDDPLSNLDNNIANNIFENCIINELKGKTRLFITHSLNYLNKADKIIFIQNGEIVFFGNYGDLIKIEEFNVFKKYIEEKESKKSINNNNNNLNIEIKKEENINNLNSKKTNVNIINLFIKYIELLGGYKQLIIIILTLILWLLFKSLSDFQLLEIGKNIEEKINNSDNIILYIFLILISSLLIYLRLIIITHRSILGNKKLHKNIISNIIKAPINLFHDLIPRTQIINNLSKDLSIIDFFSSVMFGNIFSFGGIFILTLIITSYFQMICFLFIPIFLIYGIQLLYFYLNCSKKLTLIESKCNQPILTLLNEAYDNFSLIKCFKVEYYYIEEFYKKLDKFLLNNYFLKGSSIWFSYILELFSLFFKMFLLTLIILFKDKFYPEIIGLILTYSIQLEETFIKFLVFYSIFENSMISFNRVLSYENILCERNINDNNINNFNIDKIEFIDVNVKYRKNLNYVLKNINLEISSNEKIGICGRTGSGKSTLSLLLIRILELNEGQILFNNINIKNIGIEKLRNLISIIPQEPFVFEGTIKENIDPYNKYDNNVILDLLNKFNEIQNNKFTLNFKISENGNNLSFGEKQIICIIRALLKKSVIIILDEATSNIDFDIEEKIYNIIYQCKKNCVFINITHRVKNLIHYDKVIVLDNGNIIENDKPSNLLKNKNSMYYELYYK